MQSNIGNDDGIHTIKLDISKATVDEPAKSAVHEIGGYKWQLIYPDGELRNHFRVECNQQQQQENDNKLWLCKATICCWESVKEQVVDDFDVGGGWVTAETRGDGGRQQQMVINRNVGTHQQLLFNGLSHASMRIVCNNGDSNRVPKAIEVKVNVVWSAKGLPKMDASLKMTFGGQSALVPVSQSILAAHSGYFDNIFNKSKEMLVIGEDGNPMHEIEEEADFNLAQFRYMIYGLYCMNALYSQDMKLPVPEYRGPRHQNFEENRRAGKEEQKRWNMSLLKLADKYQLQPVVYFAETNLIKLGLGNMELLKFAEEFELAALKQHCLRTIHPVDFCKQFEQNCEIRDQLKKETRGKLDEAWKKATPHSVPAAQSEWIDGHDYNNYGGSNNSGWGRPHRY